jgi:TetR/AcrR family transcriptional repressor of nem operon
MRRSREEAARTRRRIVAAASRLFRARGVAEVSIADVMDAAGLTVGGFYRHFASKEALVAEAIAAASDETMGQLGAGPGGGARRLQDLLAAYLSDEHRAQPGRGCPIAALCSEMGHAAAPTRAAFTAALRRMLALVAAVAPGSSKAARRGQLHAAAAAVGGLMLARASDDDQLAREIMDAVRRGILDDMADQADDARAR